MDTAHILPHVTAGLNALTAVLLVIAYGLIRRGQRAAHRKVMLGAVCVSAVFLACYILYHFTAPIFVFAGQGPVRQLYYMMLISHVLLAAVVVPMIVMALWQALAGNTDLHRKIARWTFPVWMYVSVSGLLVYAMLYHIYAPKT
ncbi:putative membrane protein [uncultured Gammaproteobacteria bacterium]